VTDDTKGARSSVAGWGTMLQAKVTGLSPDEVDFFNLPNPSSRAVALEPTQPLTEISTRNLPGVKGGLPARKADSLTIQNVGDSMSHNPMGLHGLLQG
jgi:hypothetical protein